MKKRLRGLKRYDPKTGAKLAASEAPAAAMRAESAEEARRTGHSYVGTEHLAPARAEEAIQDSAARPVQILNEARKYIENGGGSEPALTCKVEIVVHGLLVQVVTSTTVISAPSILQGAASGSLPLPYPASGTDTTSAAAAGSADEPQLPGHRVPDSGSMPGWLQSLELVGSSVFLAFVTLQWLLVAVLAFSLLAVSCVSYHLPRATWMTPKIKNLGAFAVVASVIVVLPFVAVWVGGA